MNKPSVALQPVALLRQVGPAGSNQLQIVGRPTTRLQRVCSEHSRCLVDAHVLCRNVLCCRNSYHLCHLLHHHPVGLGHLGHLGHLGPRLDLAGLEHLQWTGMHTSRSYVTPDNLAAPQLSQPHSACTSSTLLSVTDSARYQQVAVLQAGSWISCHR